MKRSENYWKNRYKQLERSQHNSSVKQFLDIQNKIDKSQSAITSKINAWYGRFASNNGVSIEEARKLLTKQELKEFKWSVEEYKKYGRENAIDGRWMKELENASARFHISRLEALRVETQNECEKLFGGLTDDIDRHIKAQYTDNYYHSAFEVMKGSGVGWEIGEINADKLDMIVKKPWAADGKNFVTRLGEDKSTLINNIYNSLVQMCVNGENPDRVIAQLAKTMKNDAARASRIIMTESAYFSQEAQKQCFNDLDVEEFEIVATLDSVTDEKCALRDGTHLPMREFQAGVTAPPFHPNCRCCTAPYFDDEWSNTGYRASRDEEGQTVYEVPANTTYEQWKTEFVKGNTGQENTTKMRKKLPIDKGIFKTYNNTLSDSVRPDNIEKSLNRNEYGSKVLKYLRDENVQVQLLYGVDNPKDLLGEYDPVEDIIKIYCDKTQSAKETSAIIVHEAEHRLIDRTKINTHDEELKCFFAEYRFRLGRELTVEEKNDIISAVDKAYDF